MKLFKYISMIVLLGIFVLSSSGFIIERYFCDTCESEHQDVIILDVNTNLKSDHHNCTKCSVDTNQCNCTHHDVTEKETDFFFLENLFTGHNKIKTEPTEISLFPSFFAEFFAGIVHFQNRPTYLLSLPPPYLFEIQQGSKNILFSVFIL